MMPLPNPRHTTTRDVLETFGLSLDVCSSFPENARHAAPCTSSLELLERVTDKPLFPPESQALSTRRGVHLNVGFM